MSTHPEVLLSVDSRKSRWRSGATNPASKRSLEKMRIRPPDRSASYVSDDVGHARPAELRFWWPRAYTAVPVSRSWSLSHNMSEAAALTMALRTRRNGRAPALAPGTPSTGYESAGPSTGSSISQVAVLAIRPASTGDGGTSAVSSIASTHNT
jgi:hypothetical protein